MYCVPHTDYGTVARHKHDLLDSPRCVGTPVVAERVHRVAGRIARTANRDSRADTSTRPDG